MVGLRKGRRWLIAFTFHLRRVGGKLMIGHVAPANAS